MGEGVRIDKWLWAARFFKTRGLATEMVDGGHVQINGARVKPSRPVKPDDEITVRRGDETYTIRVTGLAEKRGSATVARGLYEETPESLAAREQKVQLHKLAAAAAPAPRRRPSKKARRQLIALGKAQR